MNYSWFLRHGVDLNDTSERQEISAWLIEVFGVHVNPEGRFSGHFADRYGGTGGAPHGGSGRCINFGAFNSKGNGATPLVASKTSHSYRHGRLQFSQALKQAIMSVVCEERFPNGAIPVLAIIDLGFSYDFKQDGKSERCAAVVRPNFIRMAHLERSIFFGRAGFVDTDQFQDAQSVKAYCQFALKTTGQETGSGEVSAVDIVETWVERVCDQLGFGRAHRIWGDYIVSSNVLLNAGWCDLELFQTLPNFGRCYNQVNNVFGQEANSVLQAARSLEFYLSKTIGKASGAWRTITSADIEKKIHQRFLHHALEALFPSKARSFDSARAGELISELYRHDQAFQYQESALTKDADHDVCSRSPKRDEIIKKIEFETLRINGYSCDSSDRNESDVARFLKPKPNYYGFRLRSECEELVSDIFTRARRNFSEIQSFCDVKVRSF